MQIRDEIRFERREGRGASIVTVDDISYESRNWECDKHKTNY